MSVRVAVVDDVLNERNTLCEYLGRIENEGKHSFVVSCYKCSEDFLAEPSGRFDLVIFDIDMPGKNGMEAARELRNNDNQVVIMFVTNVAQYAINGYEVDAVDYVLKPLSYFDFVMKINRALNKIAKNQDASMLLDTVDGVCSVNMSQIVYVEVMLHYIIYHMQDGQLRSRNSMKDAEKSLFAHNFRRCHKSFLVNLKHVSIIRAAEVKMDDESIVPISRKYKNAFMQDYVAFVKG